MCMSDCEVHCDETSVPGNITFQYENRSITNPVSYSKKSDKFGFHAFNYRCNPSQDIICVHIIAFVKCLSSGAHDVGDMPDPKQMVSHHLSAKRLSDQ